MSSANKPREKGDHAGHAGRATEHTSSPRLLPEVVAAHARDVFSLLLVFRWVNAICLRTFFQPDEYFQSLEPAWNIAFGPDSGAWLTWVHCPTPLSFSWTPLLTST